MKHFARHIHRSVIAAVVILLGFASSARAQDSSTPPPPPAEPPALENPTAPPAEPQSLQPAAPATTPAARANPATPRSRGGAAFSWGDSTGMVLPPLADVRTPEELDVDYASWQQLRSRAESRMLKSRERSVRWKSQVEIQKSQIDLLGKQSAAAKKEKRDADKKDADLKKKREEKKRDYFDSMRQVMEAAADHQKTQVDLAQVRMVAIDQERKLHRLWSANGYEGRLSAESRAAEQQMLTLVKQDADLLTTLASREKALADKNLNALKLWGELQK